MIIFILLVLALIGCIFLTKYDDVAGALLGGLCALIILISIIYIIVSHVVVPKTNDECGVAYAIEKYILGE